MIEQLCIPYYLSWEKKMTDVLWRIELSASQVTPQISVRHSHGDIKTESRTHPGICGCTNLKFHQEIRLQNLTEGVWEGHQCAQAFQQTRGFLKKLCHVRENDFIFYPKVSCLQDEGSHWFLSTCTITHFKYNKLTCN